MNMMMHGDSINLEDYPELQGIHDPVPGWNLDEVSDLVLNVDTGSLWRTSLPIDD